MRHRIGPISITDGHIVAVDHSPDIDGRHVAAGFIDLQVNGGWGHDFTNDPGSIWKVGELLPRTGVTSFLPTIVSAPYSVAEAAIAVLVEGPPPDYRGADPIGLHIEGPWIAPDWKGAHDPRHLRLPDLEVATRWAASGVVRMVTMAPELFGADEVAALLSDSGVVVSAGHSGADYETGVRALAADWVTVTHLFNGMPPFHHRDPGLVGAALTSPRSCGLIVDGLHNHSGAVRLAWEVLGPERLILITDAVAATGMGAGTFRLGDREMISGPNGPRDANGALAGSVLTMDRAVANLVAMTGATGEEALASAARTPAGLLGLTDRGALDPGMRADLVWLGPGLAVHETMIRGESVFRREGHSP